jgi:hypothetical protein
MTGGDVMRSHTFIRHRTALGLLLVLAAVDAARAQTAEPIRRPMGPTPPTIGDASRDSSPAPGLTPPRPPTCPTGLPPPADHLLDGGFEQQQRANICPPWQFEGTGFKGIDLDKGLAQSGRNNAFIRTPEKAWNGVRQFVRTKPGKPYMAEISIRTSPNVRDGYFGVRNEVGGVVKEVKFGPLPQYKRLVVAFKGPARQTGVMFFVGYWGPGGDSWIQIDDASCGQSTPFGDDNQGVGVSN